MADDIKDAKKPVAQQHMPDSCRETFRDQIEYNI